MAGRMDHAADWREPAYAAFIELIEHAAAHGCGPRFVRVSPGVRITERIECAEFDRLEAEYWKRMREGEKEQCDS